MAHEVREESPGADANMVQVSIGSMMLVNGRVMFFAYPCVVYLIVVSTFNSAVV